MAVLPGGVAGRTFHPHQKDLVDGFMDGSVQYWWFSDAAIKAHAQKTLTLVPQSY
jgi:penicillin amidase